MDVLRHYGHGYQWKSNISHSRRKALARWHVSSENGCQVNIVLVTFNHIFALNVNAYVHQSAPPPNCIFQLRQQWQAERVWNFSAKFTITLDLVVTSACLVCLTTY
jgi:hypothetical protein